MGPSFSGGSMGGWTKYLISDNMVSNMINRGGWTKYLISDNMVSNMINRNFYFYFYNFS